MIQPWLGTIIPWSAPLRAMPHKDAKRPHEGVLKDLPRGTQVTVLGKQGAWLNVRVTLGNKPFSGYLSQELVRFVSQAPPEKPKPVVSQVGIPQAPKALLATRQRTAAPDKDNTTVKPRENLKRYTVAELAQQNRNEILDGLQTVLDLVGFIPGLGEVADLTNAGISAMRGNYLEAALSLISIIPGVGDAIGKGAKYALKFGDSGVARKTLTALRSVDIAGFFKKLAGHPQLMKYVAALQQSLRTLEQELLRLANPPSLQLAIPGGGYLPSNSLQNHVVQMSGNTAGGGFKQGDHIFNKGLTKLGMAAPKNALLDAAFKKFQNGLKNIEMKGGFELKADKGAHGADPNSTLFGDRIQEVRNAWDQLNRVLDNASSNAQHRAAAVSWLTDALKKLRQASLDDEAVATGLRGAGKGGAKKLNGKIQETAKELDKVFGDMVHEIEKLMPSPGAVGQSMAGLRGKPPTPKKR
ncbi:MAG TPA: hypothetical protein VK539_35020 [Myxococcaceae bacterium]|nr:hypothetical protein [Myxococcaceae bacterium]